MSTVTRFAPSPTGRLHIGHAYSALFSYEQAQKDNGRFLLRIEDIDTGRCRPEFEDGFYEDLSWLGLEWETPVRRQSEHFDDYKKALTKLQDRDLLYPCFCTRKDILAETQNAVHAPHSHEGPLYPGTCKNLSAAQIEDNIGNNIPYALRLNLETSLSVIDRSKLVWVDKDKGKQSATPEILGDVILARKDISASYHLCVTLDDHIQDITLVTRGEDLFHASHLHRLLQELLELNVPEYYHHGLLLDENGQRLAKRYDSTTLQHMRETSGYSAQDIKDKIQDLLKISN